MLTEFGEGTLYELRRLSEIAKVMVVEAISETQILG